MQPWIRYCKVTWHESSWWLKDIPLICLGWSAQIQFTQEIGQCYLVLIVLCYIKTPVLVLIASVLLQVDFWIVIFFN